MKKVIKLKDLDCAVCAVKIEDAVKKIDGINNVSVSFMTQKMILDVQEEKYTNICKSVKKTVKKIEPDVSLEF